MRSTTPALHALHVALDALPPPHSRKGPALGNWRWTVRQRLGAVRDLLVAETDTYTAAWRDATAAGETTLLTARNMLLERIRIFDNLVLQSPEPDAVRRDLMRLLVDVDHHVARLREVVAATRAEPRPAALD
ncbi:hypothetical protein RDV89_09165 [Nocardioides zeae]|uniref:DUF4254 domain-containing protein n=1 Tax=Nocardioides imazamoxiresistens TaxID=3231893 RepID=A0ABU3PVJ1_9ACTN|nr:hypothetical protein [Nocardioides zeae]MDT9593236.1 hypothetical protein [Nocardioides zeae]